MIEILKMSKTQKKSTIPNKNLELRKKSKAQNFYSKPQNFSTALEERKTIWLALLRPVYKWTGYSNKD